MARFVVDTQLPAALSHWLTTQGHMSEHVLYLELAQGKDDRIWRYAAEHQAVIITKDEDFAEWVLRGRMGPSVVWLRMGNSSKGALLTWFAALLPSIVNQLETGERLVEVRG